MHQRGIFNSILVFSIVALLSCAMPYKATGAGSGQSPPPPAPPAFGERLGDFNATNTRAVCNVEDKTTRADKMPMLINYVFPVESGKSDHR